MHFSSLPLATQMLLEVDVRLDSLVCGAWAASCVAASLPSEAGGESTPRTAVELNKVVQRREPRRYADTDDFFHLAEALDTLADTLYLPTISHSGKASPNATSGQRKGLVRIKEVSQFDPHGAVGLNEALQAEALEAHRCLGWKNYARALELLLHISSACAAHELSPALLNNVAVCHYRLEQWNACEVVTHRVISMDPTERYPSARRLVYVYICQGRAQEAQQQVSPHREDPEWARELSAVKAFHTYTNLLSARQFGKALTSLNTLLTIFPCGSFEAAKARLLSLENAMEAVRYASKQRQAYPLSAELQLTLWELTFHCSTSKKDLNDILEDMRDSSLGSSELRFRLLSSQIMRCRDASEELNALIEAKAWPEVTTLSGRLLHETFLAEAMKGIVFYSRAQALAEQRSWYAALDDAHRALSYTEEVEVQARILTLVARCEVALDRLRDAVYHLEKSLQLHYTSSNAEYLRSLKARLEQEIKTAAASVTGDTRSNAGKAPKPKPQQSKTTTVVATSLEVHYRTLALSHGANAAEVRASYRALAMKWHPDRWCGSPEEQIRVAEVKFKAIQHAYEEIMKCLS